MLRKKKKKKKKIKCFDRVCFKKGTEPELLCVEENLFKSFHHFPLLNNLKVFSFRFFLYHVYSCVFKELYLISTFY
jgi:hypothetical protein